MSEQIREYLTLKNILVIILIWVILLFINPAGNGWLFLPEEYSKDWLIYFIGDSLVLITCFTFKALIDRDYGKVFFLSGIALLNLSIVYFVSIRSATYCKSKKNPQAGIARLGSWNFLSCSGISWN